MIVCECGHTIKEHGNTLYLGCMHCGCDHSQETVEARYWARRMMKERDDINGWNNHHFYLWTDSQKECEILRSNYKRALNLAQISIVVISNAIDFIKWAKIGSIGTIHRIDSDGLSYELDRINKDLSEFIRIDNIRNMAK